jgi:hypothetical protein
MRCIGCGCTNEQACPGGCSWISHAPPKCSACFDEDGEPLELDAGEDSGLYSVERCPASPSGSPHTPIWLTEATGYCARCKCGFAA